MRPDSNARSRSKFVSPFRYLIALGSNLGERASLIEAASRAIGTDLGLVIARSCLLETDPVGVADRPFLNGALTLASSLAPEAVMAGLLEIEARLGRVRRERWGNRTIDLDLLMGEDASGAPLVISTDLLSLPHPRMLERSFVLLPAAEIAGDWLHPLTGQSLLSACESLCGLRGECPPSAHPRREGTVLRFGIKGVFL